MAESMATPFISAFDSRIVRLPRYPQSGTKLANRIALMTGSSSGIGAREVVAFARADASPTSDRATCSFDA